MLVAVHKRALCALLIDDGLRFKGAELRRALGAKLVPLEDVEREAGILFGALEHTRAEHLIELRCGLVDALRERRELRVAFASSLEPPLERLPRDARGLAGIAERGADAARADDRSAEFGSVGEGARHQSSAPAPGSTPALRAYFVQRRRITSQ